METKTIDKEEEENQNTICEDCGDIPNDYPTVRCQKCGGNIVPVE